MMGKKLWKAKDGIFSSVFWEDTYDRLERLSFFKVFAFWVGSILLFGLAYFLLRGPGTLLATDDNVPAQSILDSVYFSFITATSTGFGDIVPLGVFRLFALIEVIIGLTLFAFVTSKLIGIKQERILREIYEISLQEKIHRIRSSLYLYRADITKIITQVEEKKYPKREVAELWSFANYFEQRVMEIVDLLAQRRKNKLSHIDTIDMKLLANSIVHSLDKTEELLKALNAHKIDWHRDTTIFAFSEACLASKKALATICEEHEVCDLDKDIALFEKRFEEIKRLLKVS
jgi:potassium channel LctB